MRNFALLVLALALFSCSDHAQKTGSSTDSTAAKTSEVKKDSAPSTTLDTALYDKLSAYLANGDTSGRWPVKHEYPLPGAILPFHRVVAYYGNIVSTKMGALGKFGRDDAGKATMIANLKKEVKEWTEADSVIPAIPCLHYIATTAQGAAGSDGMWRLRMPTKYIDTVLAWAKEIDAIVFLDIQVGLSDVRTEVPYFEKYLSMPNVHLGIDPEFAMKAKGNKRPGSVIGSLDAEDINWVGNYLADLVKKNNLPPKIYMIHRFTQGMVTNYKNIKLHPELQIVMDMDGWGYPEKKKSTYYSWIAPQPVQFTGFKLFYVNDTEKSGQKEMMSKKEVLNLRPKPIYIQYQ